MAKIAILVERIDEDLELQYLRFRLKEAGYVVDIIGPKVSEICLGSCLAVYPQKAYCKVQNKVAGGTLAFRLCNCIVRKLSIYASRLIDLFNALEAVVERRSMKSKPSYTSTVLAGKALVKFCDDHQRPSAGLSACVQALEAGDVQATTVAFKAIPWGGGMMSFNDWIPPVVFESETADYVDAVFVSLSERFYRLAVDLLDLKRRA